MKKCCRKTFILALKQVLNMIETNNPIKVQDIVSGLEYAVSILEKDEEK